MGTQEGKVFFELNVSGKDRDLGKGTRTRSVRGRVSPSREGPWLMTSLSSKFPGPFSRLKGGGELCGPYPGSEQEWMKVLGPSPLYIFPLVYRFFGGSPGLLKDSWLTPRPGLDPRTLRSCTVSPSSSSTPFLPRPSPSCHTRSSVVEAPIKCGRKRKRDNTIHPIVLERNTGTMSTLVISSPFPSLVGFH